MGDYELDTAAFGKLTTLIYSAVFDGSRWQNFLEELTRVTGGVRTHLFGFDIPAGISLGLTAAGYDPGFIESYNQYYGEINAWAPRFAEGTPGTVIPSQWMCSKDALFRTEFYHDWVLPQENVAAGGGSLLFKDETRMLAFGGNIRLKDEEKLEQAWLRTVGILTPHLQQAFEIARVMASRSLENDLLRKGHMSGEAALLLVADNGFVLYANDSAADMLSRGTVLRGNHNGRVSFSDGQAAAMLERCLSALRAGKPTVSTTFPAYTPTPDRTGHPQNHTVRAIAFDPAMHGVPPFPLTLGYVGRSLLVTITRAEQVTADKQDLTAEHGLSAAESEIVLGIADGKTQAELAHERSVSIHTVRNQLKSAMSKMGLRRQTDVVRMVGRLRP